MLLVAITACRSARSVVTSRPQEKSLKIASQKISISRNHAVHRVVQYDIWQDDIPSTFDGYRIAFISDLHYRSLLKERGLKDLVTLLNDMHPNALLMGGDYQEGCEYVSPLFSSLSNVKTTAGTFGVLGNNDYERCYEEIVQTMKSCGMRVLEHQVDTLQKDSGQILVAGVRNPFDKQNNVSPTLRLSDKDFVILLVHTPDYAENVSIEHTDLVLAGHTHGGQVRFFGHTPANNSRYRKRFLSGLAFNSKETPLIITNGIGTSRLAMRIGAQAEIIMITLHHNVK